MIPKFSFNKLENSYDKLSSKGINADNSTCGASKSHDDHTFDNSLEGELP